MEGLDAMARLSASEQAIAERLTDEGDRFNVRTTGITDAREFLGAERGEDGALLGGVHGWSWGGTCWIQALWVRAETRRTGLGGRLRSAAEAIARDRGCAQLALDTHPFGPPRRLGGLRWR